MDASPLVRAHDHAVAAAVATRQAADTTVTISEHAHAAGEFANAARHTTSVEALRTLKLLEDHHRRLAALLRLPPQSSASLSSRQQQQQQPASARPENENDGVMGEKAEARPSSENLRPVVAVDDDGAAPRGKREAPARTAVAMSGRHRFASREMSSSIASNLASARGIRSRYRGQPLSPSVSSDQAPGNLDPHLRRDGSRTKMRTIMDQTGKPAWVPPAPSPPSSMPRRTARTRDPPPRVDGDGDQGGYARFYNTFGSIITKISAPLAFAGLPLIQEEESSLVSEPTSTSEAAAPSSPTPSPPKRKPGRQPSSLGQEPDLSGIYSKATMRALARDSHAASDSVYVVPTSGHTMSYANILSYAEKEKRRFGASTHGELLTSGDGDDDDDDEDFVDARETLVPLSLGAARRRAARTGDERELRNHVEELSLENKSLKDMLDNVSKRLHAFEASSQHSAMALAESYRFMRPGSPAPGGRHGDEALRRRARDAEEQLAAAAKQVERLEKDNRKMQRTLDKYREKWETLKAGAKARREAQVGESVEDARQG